MDKDAVRGVVQFFYMEGKTAQEIYDLIRITLGENYPSNEVIALWLTEFESTNSSITSKSN